MQRLLVLVLLACLAAVLPAAAQTRWDLATAYPADNFLTQNVQQFAGDVERASGGKLRIVLHPGGSLLKAREIKRAVQANQVQAGEILLVNHEREDPLYGLDAVPFLATSYADAMKLYRASRKALDERFAAQGMRLLFTVPWPPQGVFSRRPLAAAGDLKGLRFRVSSPATRRIAELTGAQPVDVASADVPRTLASGGIEALMSSGATGVDSHFYEHLKYFYDARAWVPKNAVIVNRKAFEALDRATQAALVRAAAEAEARGWKLSEERNRWYLDQLRDKGMTVAVPNEQLTADLRKVGNVVLAEWQRKSGDGGRRLVEAYRGM